MKTQPTLPPQEGLQTRLAEQLSSRARLITIVAILALILGIITDTISKFLNAHANVINLSRTVVAEFDEFLARVDGDLKAVSDGLVVAPAVDLALRDTIIRIPVITSLRIANLNGTVVADRRRSGRGQVNVRIPIPWKETIQKRQTYVSGVYTDLGAPMVDIVVPIDNEDDKIYAALIARIDITGLWSNVASIREVDNRLGYVAQGDGRLLIYRDIELVLEGVNVADRIGQTPQELGIPRAFNLIQGFEGELALAYAARMKTVPWYVIVEQPLGMAIQSSLGTTILYLIGFVVVGTLLVRHHRFTETSIVRPLRELRKGVEKFREESLDTRITLSNPQQNEIGLLANILNSMAERLQMRTEQLIYARNKADESSRLKAEFVSTMSHEFRTPLNAILGFTSILLEGMGGEMDDDARHMITRVGVNAASLREMISDFLDLSRIEAGRMDMIESPQSLSALVDIWVTQHEILAKDKHLALEVFLDPTLPDMILSDGEHLTKIARNLLSNAIKFTKEGKVTLRINHLGTDQFMIQVEDTGIGIPPHAHTIIFEEFRQVDGSTRRQFGGTGLGLAICQRLTKLLGGTITLHSAIGVGSIFTVTLPLKPATPTQLEKTAAT
ncbi:MAG TPA: ATP-binding protein [Aggregatilineales bacterium]|nr:HAMP domain-containing protein [Anaerolineales bacterium]HRE49121.1 ATP-binding protein [Aggregatilineales bacterium]